MTDAELDNTVYGLIAEISAVRAHELRPSTRLREDLNLDSVASMELISLLDESLHVEVSIDEAMSVATVGDVVKLCRRHVALA